MLKKLPAPNYKLGFIVLAVLLLIYASYLLYFKLKKPIEIDVVGAPYSGPVVLSGIIQKDAPVGQRGVYILVTESNLVVINQQGLDGLVGKKVVISGEMSPPDSTYGDKNVVQPSSIEVIK